MAIGGSLRAALKAGNWARTAMESRRRARALADLNARGGIRGTGRMNMSLERGIDDATWARGPRGNEVFIDPSTGARRVPFDPRMEQMRRGSLPIEAPYEGFRVWPGTRLPGFGEPMNVGAVPGGTMRSIHSGVPFSVNAPPPWIGRGPGPTPTTGRFFPRDMETGGGRMYDWEMGDLQGRQFFAPSTPVPIRPYYDDMPWWADDPAFLF